MKLDRIAVILAAVGLGATILAASAAAQAPQPPPPPDQSVFYRELPNGPGGAVDFTFVGFERGPAEKVVKGAPYSAESSTETTQTLADGNRISRKATGLVYRDSEGRTRREHDFPAPGPLAAAGEVPRFVGICDPVSGARYMLHEKEKIAIKTPIGGPGPGKHRDMKAKFEAGMGPGETQAESLGKQTIEGIETEGTRTTITLAAGQIGNDRPIVIVFERWYSPDLQTVVMSKHTDPRLGETVFRLTNIRREEQPRSLFEVPADYAIQEGRTKGRMIMSQPMPLTAVPGPPPDERL